MSEQTLYPIHGIDVAPESTQTHRVNIPSDGRIVGVVPYFPSGSETYMRLRPKHGNTAMFDVDESGNGGAVPQTDSAGESVTGWLFGDSVNTVLPVDIGVAENDTLAVEIKNTDTQSAGDAGLTFVVDHRDGLDEHPEPTTTDIDVTDLYEVFRQALGEVID